MFHFKCHLLRSLLHDRILLHIILKLPHSVGLGLKNLYIRTALLKPGGYFFLFAMLRKQYCGKRDNCLFATSGGRKKTNKKRKGKKLELRGKTNSTQSR